MTIFVSPQEKLVAPFIIIYTEVYNANIQRKQAIVSVEYRNEANKLAHLA
jgi:hypothetical protein